MWKQNNLFGEQLPMNKENPELPPEHACTETCYTATEEKCTCRCGGAYHGLGNHNKRQLPECRPLDKAEKIIASLKNAKEAFL